MAEHEAVRWREWDAGTFAEAEAEGKLVFLDISAKWCHWCHVLDRTSLSDPRVVRLLNDSFVPVRVDTDRRPDINDRYNQGGWPTTAVLLPNGQLLTGATYLPPDSLFEVLGKCAEFYRHDRARIERYMQESAGKPAPAGVGENTESPPSEGPHPEDLALVKHSVLAHYDPQYPGFFREPKFLVPEILAFLRDSWTAEENGEMGETFLKVLRTMGSGAVFDPVEGGFFRYATLRDWTAPHYEKLLADNSEMLSLYASAYERTGEKYFAAVAGKILRFLFARLRDTGTGAFYSSQDADEEYYLRDAEGRSGLPVPSVDRTVISEYNGRAVSGLVSAHRAFGSAHGIKVEEEMTLLSIAGKLGNFLRNRLWSAEEGQIRFRDDGAVESGLLADNVAVAEAYLDLFDAGADDKFLGWSGEILEGAVRRLFSPGAFGFLDRRPREGDSAALQVQLVPFSLNARMACALMRYSRVAGRTDLFAVAGMTLKGLSAEFGPRAAFGAPYGSALLQHRISGSKSACLPGDPSCTAGGEDADAPSTGFRAG
ncbi:MAG: thioredoxin domain-containing protein [Deltaproteobacteria bacterium]|nr:thioredoxin domain-containing protein [Deltaproteobacteria bacterium]